jgi:hypothetical protein
MGATSHREFTMQCRGPRVRFTHRGEARIGRARVCTLGCVAGSPSEPEPGDRTAIVTIVVAVAGLALSGAAAVWRQVRRRRRV